MARIRQRELFSWRDLGELKDLERLKMVIEHVPDEELMVKLERERGRDEHPVRGMWNSILAGIVYPAPIGREPEARAAAQRPAAGDGAA